MYSALNEFQELMSAAMGINLATIPDPKIIRKYMRETGSDPNKSLTSPSFAVTQALVALLAKKGGKMSSAAMASCSSAAALTGISMF